MADSTFFTGLALWFGVFAVLAVLAVLAVVAANDSATAFDRTICVRSQSESGRT